MVTSSPAINAKWENHIERFKRSRDAVQAPRAIPITSQNAQENGKAMRTAKKTTVQTAAIELRIEYPVDRFKSSSSTEYSSSCGSGGWKIRCMANPFPPQSGGGSLRYHHTTTDEGPLRCASAPSFVKVAFFKFARPVAERENDTPSVEGDGGQLSADGFIPRGNPACREKARLGEALGGAFSHHRRTDQSQTDPSALCPKESPGFLSFFSDGWSKAN
jgi:hypothetical protein